MFSSVMSPHLCELSSPVLILSLFLFIVTCFSSQTVVRYTLFMWQIYSLTHNVSFRSSGMLGVTAVDLY